MKYCPKCNRDLPKKLFYKNRGRYDGFQSYCMPCKAGLSKNIYDENPLRYNYTAHRYAIKAVLKTLGKKTVRGQSLESLYDYLVKSVLENPKKAVKNFPNGAPDCLGRRFELKIYLDSLRQDQLVWNILNGHSCKVRWFPSYEELENAIMGRKSKGRLFRSYKEFILWKYGQ